MSNKNKMVGVYLTQEEYDKFKKESTKAGRSMSKQAYMIIIKHMDNNGHI